MSSMLQSDIMSEMSPSHTFTRSINGASHKILSLPSGEKNCKIMEQNEEENNEIEHFVDSSNSVNYSLGYRSNKALSLLHEDQISSEIKEEELEEVDDDKTESFVDSSNSPINYSFETEHGDRMANGNRIVLSRVKKGCNNVDTYIQKGSVWVSDVMNSIKIELAALSDMSETDTSKHGNTVDKGFEGVTFKEEANRDDEDRQESVRTEAPFFSWRSFSDEMLLELKQEPEEFREPGEYRDQGLGEKNIPVDDNHDMKAEHLECVVTRDSPGAISRKPWLWPLSRLGVEYLDSSEDDKSSLGDLGLNTKICLKPKCSTKGKKSGKLKQKARKQHICQVCNQVYPKPSHLIRHLRVHTGEKPYKCEYCTKAFRLSTSLRAHIRVHTGEKPYQCPVCSELFRQRSTLHNHFLAHTGLHHKCSVCEKAFGRRSHLKRHQLCHTGEKPECCDVCGKRFRDNDSLRKHAWSHNTTTERPFKCETCGKSFINNPSLTSHARIHTGDRTFMCDICGARFGRRSHLHRHNLTHTGEKPHQCATCGRAFTRSSHLARHRERLGCFEKDFHCYVCLEKFSSSEEVKHHFSFALVESKHFKCRECGAEFAKVLELNRHMNVHRKVKVYQCELCLKCYKKASGLVLHQRSHTGEKPYICEYCATSFSRSASYHKHRRIHFREKAT